MPLLRELHEALAALDAPTPCQVNRQVYDDPESRGEASRLCRECPVLLLCGQYATRARERWGIWGGRNRRARERDEDG